MSTIKMISTACQYLRATFNIWNWNARPSVKYVCVKIKQLELCLCSYHGNGCEGLCICFL